MRNKKFIWILLPCVLLIWGAIFFQVKQAVSSNGRPVKITTVQAGVKTLSADTSSYQLKLEYEDPFLRNHRPIVIHQPSTNPGPTPKKPVVKKTVVKIPLKWPVITYRGLISNKKDKRNIIYLVEVDGASVFMHPGEVKNDLHLLQANPDSIRLEFKGEEKKTFIKQ